VADADDMREGLDAIQGDMAKHQRMFRGEVTAEANRQLAVAEFEKLDRIRAEEPSVIADAPAKPSDLREVNGRTYRMDRAQVDDIAFRKATTDEAKTVAKIEARLMLLLDKAELGSKGDGFMPEFVGGHFRHSRTPVCWLSWRDRVLAVMGWKAAAQQPGNILYRAKLEAMHTALLLQLMDDSISAFGDWKADPEKTIQVGG
jgi:hypothetical protein